MRNDKGRDPLDPHTWGTIVKASQDIISQAEEYARMSEKFTENFEGWEDGYKKEQRIRDGRIAQASLVEVAKKHGLSITLDSTDHTTIDKFDVIIHNEIIESKTTRMPALIGQIHQTRRQRQVNYYCFSRIDWRNSICYVTFLGLVPFAEYWERAIRVEYNQNLPGTTIQNRFKNGTYILNRHTGYEYKSDSISLDFYLESISGNGSSIINNEQSDSERDHILNRIGQAHLNPGWSLHRVNQVLAEYDIKFDQSSLNKVTVWDRFSIEQLQEIESKLT